MSEDFAEDNVLSCPVMSIITKPVDLAFAAVEKVVEAVTPGDVIPDE
jgi:hypothetical protein